MPTIYTKEYLSSLSLLTVYRQILKNIKYYPSKNRFQLILATKEGSSLIFYFKLIPKFIEFRKSKELKDERQIFLERKKAWMGLAHVLYYKERADEFYNNYAMVQQYIPPINPKDKDFIYF